MNHLCDDQKWKDKMCQLYKFTWQYEMGTLLELNVPVLKWGKELKKKKKKWRDKFFVCVRARTCVFYNLKVPHVVSWIYNWWLILSSPMLIFSFYHISLVQVWFCTMNHEFYAIGVYKHNLRCIWRKQKNKI